MTATPRIYDDSTKSKAKDADAELCSMDDPKLYGEEFYRLGFGEAVGAGLLSDYQVLVLAVDEKYVSSTFQQELADRDNALTLPDIVKITGCWNGLAKRLRTGGLGELNRLNEDATHMRRAVAFSRSIDDSKLFIKKFESLIESYKMSHPDADNVLNCEFKHVDGTFHALQRNACLDWLKAEAPPETCRILSNAR